MTDTTSLQLAAIHDGPDSRFLDVEVEENGDVSFSGQDLGPATSPVSSDGEYEYGFRIAKSDVPAAVAALGGAPDEPIRTVLLRHWTGLDAFRIQSTLEAAGLETHLWTYSG